MTDAAVTAFESRLGAALPEDYREFLLDVNGGQTASSHSQFHIRNDQTVLNSLYSLDDPDERSDLATRWQQARAWLPAEVLPIGSDDFSGMVVLVVVGPRRGQVWFLDAVDPRPEGSNPRVEWFDRRDVSKVADSFREFMTNLTPLDAA